MSQLSHRCWIHQGAWARGSSIWETSSKHTLSETYIIKTYHNEIHKHGKTKSHFWCIELGGPLQICFECMHLQKWVLFWRELLSLQLPDIRDPSWTWRWWLHWLHEDLLWNCGGGWGWRFEWGQGSASFFKEWYIKRHMESDSKIEIKPAGNQKQFQVKQSKYKLLCENLPTRALLCDPSGSGKTVLLQQMIMNLYDRCFSRIFLFSPSVNHDSVWEPVKEYI